MFRWKLTHRVNEVFSHTPNHQAVLEVKVKPGWKAGTKAAGGGGWRGWHPCREVKARRLGKGMDKTPVHPVGLGTLWFQICSWNCSFCKWGGGWTFWGVCFFEFWFVQQAKCYGSGRWWVWKEMFGPSKSDLTHVWLWLQGHTGTTRDLQQWQGGLYRLPNENSDSFITGISPEVDGG